MRQAGVLAAAGIVALETMVDRLADDHRRAKTLATGLSAIPDLALDPGSPCTNMIFLCLAETSPLTPSGLVDLLAQRGIRIGRVGDRRFRLVTHYSIDDAAVDRVIATFDMVMKGQLR
jgi:threonine aldolase